MRKVIRKRIRHAGGGTEVAADIQAVVVANVGRGRGSRASVSTRTIGQTSGVAEEPGSGRERPDAPPADPAPGEGGR